MALSVKRPYWTDVRGIGNSLPARAVILIPLVGYWIIFNEQLLQLAALSPALHADGPSLGGHISPRLFATYFGLCFIAIGSLIYQLRCPPEVQLYPTASAYVGGIFPSISGIEEMRVDQALHDGDEESRAARERIENSFHGWGTAVTAEVVRQTRENASKNRLQTHFDLCNRRNPIARVLTAFSYSLGLTLLAVPAADIFLRVTHALVRSLI